MVTTVRQAGAPSSAPGKGRLPSPARDRRPALAALALLLVLGGALGSAVIAYRSGDRVDVLVARTTIDAGESFDAADFATARVAAEDAAVVPSAAVGNFSGSVATVAIPEGTLLNAQMFSDEPVIPDDAAVVGVVLSDQQSPAELPSTGDVVRIFIVPREDSTGSGAVGTEVVEGGVRVVGTGDGDGAVKLSLLVPEDEVAAVVGAAATGQVSVARLSEDTEPVIDLERD